ncbi:N-acetylglucosamine repressor [Defluviimonas aquaemixtae]|uniref:N-acetylglucosamine repressor n=1 Tax=Albidovulum aquaemixtae TaxID=1542388 RepID=A0A2R8BKC7_9RHOB|nr:ROK family transcriptional regulator [Defluviimonas aquaemixtae]SPH23750.1 N-acetylglucosamine repressor [Defluviimonas aquaemixtae]
MTDKTQPAAVAFERGSNQSGMRAHNERVVLSMIRRHGALAKAEIARLSGLSAQTVSVIMRALEADGLLVRGEPLRGKVGQPSIPMGLAPGGAYFLGLKIGRRSADLVLTNFLGKVISRVHLTYRHPEPDATVKFALDAVAQLSGQLTSGERARIAGLGIAMPFQIWDWARALGVHGEAMEIWRDRDIRAEIAAKFDFPVYLQNDASCACGAELVFGDAEVPRNFLYFYIGYFIGGGVVLNGSLYTGLSGNAGALGSMPVPAPGDGGGQLIDVASLSVIERLLEEGGKDPQTLWETPASWSIDADLLDQWINGAAPGLAHAISAASSVLDFEAVMIDGWIPEDLRARLVERTRAVLYKVNLAGITPPEIREGTIGPDARALGAASLPLSERFLMDRNAFQSA